jgi:hypothetical protein
MILAIDLLLDFCEKKFDGSFAREEHYSLMGEILLF